MITGTITRYSGRWSLPSFPIVLWYNVSQYKLIPYPSILHRKLSLWRPADNRMIARIHQVMEVMINRSNHNKMQTWLSVIHNILCMTSLNDYYLKICCMILLHFYMHTLLLYNSSHFLIDYSSCCFKYHFHTTLFTFLNYLLLNHWDSR